MQYLFMDREFISYIRCFHFNFQYDSPNIPDVHEVYGTVSCRCTLEGLTPDISLVLGYQQDSLHNPIDNIIVNPCVQHCDIQTLSKGKPSEEF